MTAAAAGAGALIRFGALSFIIIVMPERPVGAQLRLGGAWFALDPKNLGGCGSRAIP